MLQKIRVHEVAKDLKLKSTELLDMFTEHGITLKNHMATLDEKQLSLHPYRTQAAKEPNKKRCGAAWHAQRQG